MKFLPMPQIETPRLRLRQVQLSDLENYHTRLTSDPEVARYMLWEANPDIAHTAATIRRIREGYANGTRYHWAIALREEDALIGTVALLRFDQEKNACSFAYMLGRAFWGRGLGTEALKAVLDFAFTQMEVTTVEADHFVDNPASGAVMRKVGMEQVDYLPGQYEKNGILRDAVLYRLTRPTGFRSKTA